MELKKTKSGHFSIEIKVPSGVKEESFDFRVTNCLLASEVLGYEQVRKLHHYLGHPSVKRLGEMIKNANKCIRNKEGLIFEKLKRPESAPRGKEHVLSSKFKLFSKIRIIIIFEIFKL